MDDLSSGPSQGARDRRRPWRWLLVFGIAVAVFGAIIVVTSPFLVLLAANRVIESNAAPTPQQVAAPLRDQPSLVVRGIVVALSGVVILLYALQRIRRIDDAERGARTEDWSG